MIHLRRMLKDIWEYLREVSGENDYARYRAITLNHGGSPMTSQAFYLSKLQHKYSRPNRCC